ncbi:hypothetical protein Sjap_012803 [Stephania japonica]|uniref:C2H2-type domain-containing protein n=1 Tax=Stephania japonica TaxID=461633 RepID=A0AAP0IWR8_9MAGN
MLQLTLNDLSEHIMHPPTEFEFSSIGSTEKSFWFNKFSSCLVNDNLSEASPTPVNLTEMATEGSSNMENQAAVASADMADGFLDYHYSDDYGFMDDALLLSNGSIDMGNHHLPDTDYNIEIPGPDSNGDLFHVVNQVTQNPYITETSLSDSNSVLPSPCFSEEPYFELESMLNVLDSAPDMFDPNQPYQVLPPTETSLFDSDSSLCGFSFFKELCPDTESILNNPNNVPNEFDPNVNLVMSNNLNIFAMPAYSPSLFDSSILNNPNNVPNEFDPNVNLVMSNNLNIFAMPAYSPSLFDSTNPLMDSQNPTQLSTENQQYQSHDPNLHGSHLFESNGCLLVDSHKADIPIDAPTSRYDPNSSIGGKSLTINFLTDSATRTLLNYDSSLPWQCLSDLGGTNQFNQNASFAIPGQQSQNGPCAFDVDNQSPQLSNFNFTTQDQQCSNDPSAFNVNDQSPQLLSSHFTTQHQQYPNDFSASNANNEFPQLFGSGFTTEIGNPPIPSSVYSFTPGSMFTEQVQPQFIQKSSNYSWLKGNSSPKISPRNFFFEKDSKNFVCPSCDMSFSNTQALGGHMSSHTREERKKVQMITKAQSNLSQNDFDLASANISNQVASIANRKNLDELMPPVSIMTENSLKVANGKRELFLECRDSGNEEGCSRKTLRLGEARK